MYKKITGVPESKQHARDELTDARYRFRAYAEHLKEKKNEFRQMKQDNDDEREEIKKEQRMAEQFKFTKMTKKVSFLPALKTKGFFKDQNSVHAIGTEYMDHRDKMKLYAPDKTFVKSKLTWNLQKTCDGDFLSREAGQEADLYDEDLKKYMRKLERGVQRPEKDKTVSNLGKTKEQLAEEVARSRSYKTRYTATNSLKWTPNNFLPTLIHETRPLLDRTHTPRGTKKAITLDRCFDKQPWIYNRTHSAHFSGLGQGGDIIAKDKTKSKILRKKLIQQRRAARRSNSPSSQRGTMQSKKTTRDFQSDNGQM